MRNICKKSSNLQNKRLIIERRNNCFQQETHLYFNTLKEAN